MKTRNPKKTWKVGDWCTHTDAYALIDGKPTLVPGKVTAINDGHITSKMLDGSIITGHIQDETSKFSRTSRKMALIFSHAQYRTLI